jgi:hypothetical protein
MNTTIHHLDKPHQALVERFFNQKIITVQSDWRGEYEKLISFTKIGITHHVSCPHAHQQNGSAKRKHRHIIEVGLSLLARASMPLKFWDEAFLAATFLINRTPSKAIHYQTPLERLYQIKPNYPSLRVFGCAYWPNLCPYNQCKLEFRSKECVFLGYNNMQKGFKCLEVNSGCLYVSIDVVFDENIFPFSKLHPNVGAHLRVDILLLPPSLIPSDLLHDGVNNIEESITNLPNPVVQKSGAVDGMQVTILQGLDRKADSAIGSVCTENNVDAPATEREPVPVRHVPASTVEADSPVEQSLRAPHLIPEADPD